MKNRRGQPPASAVGGLIASGGGWFILLAPAALFVMVLTFGGPQPHKSCGAGTNGS